MQITEGSQNKVSNNMEREALKRDNGRHRWVTDTKRSRKITIALNVASI